MIKQIILTAKDQGYNISYEMVGGYLLDAHPPARIEVKGNWHCLMSDKGRLVQVCYSYKEAVEWLAENCMMIGVPESKPMVFTHIAGFQLREYTPPRNEARQPKGPSSVIDDPIPKARYPNDFYKTYRDSNLFKGHKPFEG